MQVHLVDTQVLCLGYGAARIGYGENIAREVQGVLVMSVMILEGGSPRWGWKINFALLFIRMGEILCMPTMLVVPRILPKS